MKMSREGLPSLLTALTRVWWAIGGSNPGPTGYEPVALTNWANGPYRGIPKHGYYTTIGIICQVLREIFILICRIPSIYNHLCLLRLVRVFYPSSSPIEKALHCKAFSIGGGGGILNPHLALSASWSSCFSHPADAIMILFSLLIATCTCFSPIFFTNRKGAAS